MGLRSLFGKKPGAVHENAKERTPPGQYLTEKWPVLHYGGVPRIKLETWSFRIWGEVEQEVDSDLGPVDGAAARATFQNDIHCVTRWSKLDNTWEGIAIARGDEAGRAQAESDPRAGPQLRRLHDQPAARRVPRRRRACWRRSTTARNLTPEHGWPLRLVVPKLYFWKSAKWVRGFEFLTRDQAGFWEMFGYHNHGDPWKEERFS